MITCLSNVRAFYESYVARNSEGPLKVGRDLVNEIPIDAAEREGMFSNKVYSGHR
jgi:hypothetical protein